MCIRKYDTGMLRSLLYFINRSIFRITIISKYTLCSSISSKIVNNNIVIFFFINKTPFFLMLGNSNFGIITLTCNLRYELLDKSFSISVLYLINFLILCTLNQVDFTGIQAPIYKKPPQPHCCGRGGFRNNIFRNYI